MKESLKKIKSLYAFYLSYLKNKRKLIDWWTIPDYSTKRKIILSEAIKFNRSEVFIETGTFMGNTVAFLEKSFDKLYSIELSKDLALKAAKRFEGIRNVTIIQGDSTTEIARLLSTLNTPVLFWLDGHYSSEFWEGDEYIITAKGEKATPILEELTQISNHSIKNHLILIDDARLFKGENDYPKLSILKDFVCKQFPNYSFKVKNDIIRILPR
jgi:hypothetical protein